MPRLGGLCYVALSTQGKQMDLRDLLDVKAICDAGSFRKAAEVLGVTQPTLSNRVAYLEDKLAARLFERDRGRSRPTQLAEVIAARVEAIGTEATLLAKDIERLAAGRTGLVRIGLGPAPGRVWLIDAIARITAEYPQIALSLTIGDSKTLAERLLERALDIVVCHTIEAAGPVITVEQELESDNIIVAHPKHAMFNGPEPTVAEVIQRYPMAIPVLEQRYLDHAKREHGIDVTRLPGYVVCSDLGLLLQLVSSRPWYFTAGPEFGFAPDLAAGRLRRLPTPVPLKHRVAIHTNRDSLPLAAVTNVQRILLEVFPSLVVKAGRG